MENLFDMKKAAEILNVSKRTVERLVGEGVLKHVRIGDRVLFSPKDLEQFIEERKVASVPSSAAAEAS